MDKKFKQFVLIMAGLWAVGVVAYFSVDVPIADLRNIRLEETFALTALSFLYLSVLVNPLYSLFGRVGWIRSLKNLQKILIGITFFFALIHATIAFFFLLGGFAGLGFLNSRFILGISLSLTSLVILAVLVAIFWKKFQSRFWLSAIYIVGVLITVHALLLGAHFITLSELIPKIFFIALAVLLLFLAAALDKWMRDRNWPIPGFGINFVLVVIVLSLFGYYYFNPNTTLPSASIHALHLAQLAAFDSRYNVSFVASPQHPKSNQEVVLKFKVYDGNSGNEVTQFNTIYDKLLHLVIVDSDLKFFNHIHPQKDGSVFTISAKFPHDGVYHLYANFQPKVGAEQQAGFTLAVGGSKSTANIPVDNSLTKVFGDKEITLSIADGSDFNAQKMSNAEQILVFDFKDAKTGQPIDDLEPYLGAFGHLVLIRQGTYEYIHIHPIASDNFNAGGPEVKFMPAALYSKITPGVYRVFGQFQRSGEVFVADFTVEVK